VIKDWEFLLSAQTESDRLILFFLNKMSQSNWIPAASWLEKLHYTTHYDIHLHRLSPDDNGNYNICSTEYESSFNVCILLGLVFAVLNIVIFCLIAYCCKPKAAPSRFGWRSVVLLGCIAGLLYCFVTADQHVHSFVRKSDYLRDSMASTRASLATAINMTAINELKTDLVSAPFNIQQDMQTVYNAMSTAGPVLNGVAAALPSLDAGARPAQAQTMADITLVVCVCSLGLGVLVTLALACCAPRPALRRPALGMVLALATLAAMASGAGFGLLMLLADGCVDPTNVIASCARPNSSATDPALQYFSLCVGDNPAAVLPSQVSPLNSSVAAAQRVLNYAKGQFKAEAAAKTVLATCSSLLTVCNNAVASVGSCTPTSSTFQNMVNDACTAAPQVLAATVTLVVLALELMACASLLRATARAPEPERQPLLTRPARGTRPPPRGPPARADSMRNQGSIQLDQTGPGPAPEATVVVLRVVESTADASCKICLSGNVDVLLNCDHTLCTACAEMVQACPFCRAPISQRRRFFL